ncbi:MAG: hypothetical protein U0Y96_01355 [Candidatus Kapaibacterium sp.]
MRTTLLLAPLFLASYVYHFSCCVSLHAQDISLRPIISGNISLSADYYTLNTEPAPFFAPRRPANLYRLVAQSTIQYGIIELPVTLMLSSQQTNVSTGFAVNQSLEQFLQNPLNIIAIEPRIGALQAHLGSYTPQYSSLTAGDVQIFGLGADFKPGRLTASAFYGVAQRAIEPTFPITSFNLTGAYQRTMKGAQFGVSSAGGSTVSFQVVHAIDDTSSVQTQLTTVTPQELFVGSVAAKINIDSTIIADAEIASNFTTRSLRAQLYQGSDFSSFSPITVRNSTRLDYAATAGVAFLLGPVKLRTGAKYIGEGFASPGFPYLQPDRIEFTVQPAFTTTDNLLNISGTVGYRINNVLSTQTATLSQLLISANGLWVMSNDWSVAATLSNFGVRNTASNDTLRIENVSRSISVSPMYSFSTSFGMQTVTLTAGYDSYDDYNVISGALSDNSVLSTFANYSVVLSTMPLTGYGGISYVSNSLKFGGYTTFSANAGSSYNLATLKLRPGLRLTYSSSSFTGGGSNTQFLVGVSCGYTISGATVLSLNATLNSFSFSTNSSYSESTIQALISTRF